MARQKLSAVVHQEHAACNRQPRVARSLFQCSRGCSRGFQHPSNTSTPMALIAIGPRRLCSTPKGLRLHRKLSKHILVKQPGAVNQMQPMKLTRIQQACCCAYSTLAAAQEAAQQGALGTERQRQSWPLWPVMASETPTCHFEPQQSYSLVQTTPNMAGEEVKTWIAGMLSKRQCD